MVATLALCFYTATRTETFELGPRVFDTGELEGRSHRTKGPQFQFERGAYAEAWMRTHAILGKEEDKAMIVRVAHLQTETRIQTLKFRSDIFETGKLKRRTHRSNDCRFDSREEHADKHKQSCVCFLRRGKSHDFFT
jgi:hypothetical protein